jgi:hypothetical protein
LTGPGLRGSNGTGLRKRNGARRAARDAARERRERASRGVPRNPPGLNRWKRSKEAGVRNEDRCTERISRASSMIVDRLLRETAAQRLREPSFFLQPPSPLHKAHSLDS